MDLQADSSESRFAAHVEGLVSVIGHADRVRPLRDYCLGLMLPCERKSVEPIAAATATERTGRRSTSRFCILSAKAAGRTTRSWRRCRRWYCPRSSVRERSRRGSSTTRAFARLIDLTKLRWRIERDYQELKQEVGLGHFEGRGWRGFHHHATLCIAAYGFLISERETIPPSGPGAAPIFAKPAVPDGYRPRGGADPTRASHPGLDRHNAPASRRRAGEDPRSMSVLQRPAQADEPSPTFMTQ
jgi:hypothetical protein